MDRDTLRRALEEGGLTAYETDAYLTLLNRGMASATEVASYSSVPSSQIYDALRSLEEEGYVETFEQDTLHARPADPADVLEDLRERGQLLVDAADEIEERWQQPTMSEHHMTVFKSADTVIGRAEEGIRNAETAVELSCRPAQFERLKDALAAARSRGVVVKVVVDCDEDPGDLFDEDLSLYASEVRACYIPGPFLAVIDHSKTCYTPNDRASEQFGLVFEDAILSFIFHWFFQMCLWSLWDPVVPRHDLPVTYVSIQGFIRDAAPLFLDGAAIDVTVEGWDPQTGEERTVSGTVADLVYPGRYRNEVPSYEVLGGRAAVVVDAGDGVLTVGGWGAVFEDVAAELVTLESVRVPDSTTV